MQKMEIARGTYYDSVTLMLVAKELNKLDGITQSSLSMGTEANYQIMAAGGFDMGGVDATPNDLIVAVMGDGGALDDALIKAREYMANPPWKKSGAATSYRPKSLDGALSIQSDSNIAVISVAGRYAADLAQDCLDRGLNVMLFSDNVSLESEISLKTSAREKGLLVMGPDCGTVIIRGVALGFANACPVGPVGIAAAAGTGLQEVHVQLAHRGIGTLHGIGTGGRDVKSAVGGITMLSAVEALIADSEIEIVVVVGKPPAPEVEQKITELIRASGKPAVLGFIGGQASQDAEPVYVCSGLEETAAVTAAVLNKKDVAAARRELTDAESGLRDTARKIGTRSGYIRGLFSGGTLCYEAQLVLGNMGIETWSNAPLKANCKLASSLASVEHSIVDYGEDEFTQGKLHPMMDLSFRCHRIAEEAACPDTGVILLDAVLGYGCHPNPAGELAEAVLKAKAASGGRVAFVASVCGVDGDPQNYTEQCRILTDAGVTVCESNARAAKLAAFILGR